MRAHMIAAALVHNPNVLPQINGSAEGLLAMRAWPVAVDAAAILARKAEVEAAMAKGRGQAYVILASIKWYDILSLKCFWADCFQILKHPPGHHERQKHTVHTPTGD